jgi:hypothetical protein
MQALGFAAPAQAEATVRVSLEAKRAVESLTEGHQAEIVVAGEGGQGAHRPDPDLRRAARARPFVPDCQGGRGSGADPAATRSSA